MKDKAEKAGLLTLKKGDNAAEILTQLGIVADYVVN